MYQANVPSLASNDSIEVTDPRTILLAEFADGPAIRELMLDPAASEAELERVAAEGDEYFPTRAVAGATGVRLHRVIAPDHGVVTQFNAETDRTPLDFLNPNGAVLAVATPGETYTWCLVALGATSKDSTVAPVLGVRAATPEESAVLDEIYPGWLDACRRFDELAATQPTLDPKSVMPPPALPA